MLSAEIYVFLHRIHMDKFLVNNEEFFAEVEKLLAEGRRVTIPVKGFSMLPFIRGERDLVELVPPGDLKVGDIVLFYDRRYVLHRIVSIDGNKLIIKGDGVINGTEHVTVDAVRAKAATIWRNGKKRVDPYSPRQKFRLKIWNLLRPFHRVILAVYRRLPWNR